MIQATLFTNGVEKYKDKLQEDNCYLISKGQVKPANKKYWSVKNDFCLVLDKGAEIVLIDDDSKIKSIKIICNNRRHMQRR